LLLANNPAFPKRDAPKFMLPRLFPASAIFVTPRFPIQAFPDGEVLSGIVRALGGRSD